MRQSLAARRWGDDGTIVFAPGVFTGLARVSAAGGSPDAADHADAGVEESHRWPIMLPGGRAVLFGALPRAAATNRTRRSTWCASTPALAARCCAAASTRAISMAMCSTATRAGSSPPPSISPGSS